MDIKKILLLLFPAIIICSDCTDIDACNNCACAGCSDPLCPNGNPELYDDGRVEKKHVLK